MGLLQTSSYGSWKSPISAKLIASSEVGLEQIKFDGNNIYWIERRAHEGGRKVIVRRSSDGTIADVTPAEFNARTRVHEYGGGDHAVSDGTLIFSTFTDQRLYRQDHGSEPKPLTPIPRGATPTARSTGAEITFVRARRSFDCRRSGQYACAHRPCRWRRGHNRCVGK
jgi:hypothetical protein